MTDQLKELIERLEKATGPDEDSERWYQANTHSTDYYDGSLIDVRYWQPLPEPPASPLDKQEVGG